MILYLKYPRDWIKKHLDLINFVAMEQDYKKSTEKNSSFST